jgi:acyl-CoA thioesterase
MKKGASSGPQAAAAAKTPSPRAVIDYMGTVNRVFQGLGVEVLEAEPGRSLFAMVVREEHTNTFGGLHGGIIFALADQTFGFTCNAKNEKAVSAGATIEFLGPAQLGDRVISEAVEVYREGRNALYDVRIWVEATGATVAHVRGRMRILGGPVMPERS